MDRERFTQTVYDVVAAIPRGMVVSYGQVARLAGRPQYSRMVGYVLHHVPAHLNLPCHRVVNSQGRLACNWPEQRGLLEAEGVNFKKNGCVDMKVFQWKYEMNHG